MELTVAKMEMCPAWSHGLTAANRNAYTAHTTQFVSQNEVPCGWSSGVGMHGDLLHRGKDSGPGPKGDSKKGRGPAGITSMPEMC